MHRLTLLILFLLLAAATSTVTAANVFNKFLMPGELIKGHAEYEEQCELCHEDLNQDKQNELCLGCHDHENVLRDIETGEGFHGRSTEVSESACSHCHTDHKGRDAQVVLLDSHTFDHNLTDFELRGAHRGVSCSLCHTDQGYVVAERECVECHRDDDVHDETLGTECSRCHTEEAWTERKFDHSRDTDYALEGRHADVACEVCHIGRKYKDTPKSCIACHQINDVHEGRNGEKCDTCHSLDGWDRIEFDHEAVAKYKLTGAHSRLKCLNCHKAAIYEQKPKTDCVACHRHDDLHNGRNGTDCKSCHSTRNWTDSRFRHDKDAGFALVGAHKGLACQACHVEPAKTVKLEQACVACHRDDDSHQGQLGESCAQCHNASGWTERVFFLHDITEFPLIGQHAVLACEECHLSNAFQDTERRCSACHQPDDVHKTGLGENCESCHNPNSWDRWIFDHDRQTNYKLIGSHAELTCIACHEPGAEKPATHCISCHRKDDEHRGRFGTNCKWCHNTESFSDVQIRR